MTADQREQALAAAERLHAALGGDAYPDEIAADFTIVFAAFTPPALPADLAEIQALRDEVHEEIEQWDPEGVMAPLFVRTRDALDALVVELAELRARPTLTAEEALALRDPDAVEYPVLVSARAKLRAIAEGAGS